MKNLVMFSRILFIAFFLLGNVSLLTAKDEKNVDLKNYFDDVLLIINFNHPHYDNIEFLEKIYSPYFKNIVFYGEQLHPKVNVVAHNLGWYVHRAIRDAMQRWPNYKGYICCQDDCFMNFWNFPRLDKNKIWFHEFWKASLDSQTHWWSWWSYPCGYTASLQAYKKLPKSAIKTLSKNCNPRTFAFSWSDFVYIPKKYRKDFIRLSKCFDAPEVFIEIAIPTLLLCLDNNASMEKLNPYWGGTVSSIDLQTYKEDYDWVHPIKLSSQDNREFILKTIESMLK
jgi:hypothetical protein